MLIPPQTSPVKEILEMRKWNHKANKWFARGLSRKSGSELEISSSSSLHHLSWLRDKVQDRADARVPCVPAGSGAGQSFSPGLCSERWALQLHGEHQGAAVISLLLPNVVTLRWNDFSSPACERSHGLTHENTPQFSLVGYSV